MKKSSPVSRSGRFASGPSADVGKFTESISFDGRLWKRALLRRLHSPLVDRYIAVSKHLERYLVERIGIRARRISQIYNGVDTQRFASGGKSLDSSLPPYMNGENLVVVGSVRRIQKVKD